MIKLTIPCASVETLCVSKYSIVELESIIANFKQINLLDKGAFGLFTPGNCSPDGFNINAW